MAVFIVMPMKVEFDKVGEAVAHSFCSHACKKNGTRLFVVISIVFPFHEPRRGFFLKNTKYRTIYFGNTKNRTNFVVFKKKEIWKY